MERCRVTCGGPATSVPQALQAFAGLGAPEPGAMWPTERTGTALATPAEASGSFLAASAPSSGLGQLGLAPPLPAAGPNVHDERTQCPQSGVWVGAAASVELRGCTIACCMGPGVKIYRGRLLAQCNTIAFSSRGANVVANGGHVVLEGNSIQGANGDGVSSWNNSIMRIEHNAIHANSGAGIAVNTGGGSVTISNNSVFDNCQAVLFATSAKAATLRDNDFAGNDRRSHEYSPREDSSSRDSQRSADSPLEPRLVPPSRAPSFAAPPAPLLAAPPLPRRTHAAGPGASVDDLVADLM